jgi:NCS1 nucleoside transporter family
VVNADRFEESLRPRFRQPRGVEQHGIEPVPEEARTTHWGDIFSIVFNFLVNPGMILIGGLAVAGGLSFWGAVIAVTLGIAVAFVPYIIVATIGVDYGVPGQVSTRMTYGVIGSRWIASLLRVAVTTFQFAFQTIAGALAIVAVLQAWLGISLPLVPTSLVFAAFQVLVATMGYGPLKYLSRIALPLKVVVLGFALYLLMSHDAPGFHPSEVISFNGSSTLGWVGIAVWANSVAAAWLTMVTDAADFCRYSRTRADMWIGTMAAAILGALLSAVLGAYGAAATLGTVSNPFDVISGITTSGVVFVALLIVVVLDNWTINVLNLYTGGLAIVNMIPRLGRFWSTLVASAIGIAISAFPAIIDGFNTISGVAIGCLFAPIAGVLVADYVVVKRWRIDVPQLFAHGGRYWYLRGTNPVAVLSTAIGAGLYFLLPEAVLRCLVTPILTGLVFVVITRLLVPRFEWARVAAEPISVPARAAAAEEAGAAVRP